MIGSVVKPGLVQPPANGLHHAVHHAARRDQVGPGLGMADALPDQVRQRRVVVDVQLAALLRQDAAMAVIGVFAEAFVGDQQDVADRSAAELRRACCTMPSSAQALEPCGVLAGRDAEEDERLDAELDGAADFVDQAIDAELKVARHRRDFLANAAAGADEERQDEILGGQRGFAHQIAEDR